MLKQKRFNNGQVYVGLSRVTLLEGLFLTGVFNKNAVKFDQRATDEYQYMRQNSKLETDKNCEKILCKCLSESEMPCTYYTIDEVASIMKSSPPKLEKAISSLIENNFLSSVTVFNPTGFPLASESP